MPNRAWSPPIYPVAGNKQFSLKRSPARLTPSCVNTTLSRIRALHDVTACTLHDTSYGCGDTAHAHVSPRNHDVTILSLQSPVDNWLLPMKLNDISSKSPRPPWFQLSFRSFNISEIRRKKDTQHSIQQSAQSIIL